MSNFIELTSGGKTLLVNTDYIISIATRDAVFTEIIIDKCEIYSREPSSDFPISEMITPTYSKILVSEDYATIKELIQRK